MEIAKDWHTTPMKVWGGSKTLWYVRACAVREYQIAKQHKIERDNKVKQEQAEMQRRKR